MVGTGHPGVRGGPKVGQDIIVRMVGTGPPGSEGWSHGGAGHPSVRVVVPWWGRTS